MYATKRVLWTFLTTCLFISPWLIFEAKAKVIEHVNVGRIVVTDQSLRGQQVAGKLAIEQVFVKLSGNSLVLETPPIKRAIENFEQFLISSSFIQKEDGLFFEATFNQQKIENLLLASGLSVWTNLRPSGLVWLAIEDENNQKTLVSQHTLSPLRNIISQQAYKRGVELIMPLGDLEDNIRVSTYDVWNHFIAKLQDNSHRYDTDYIINATLQPFNQSVHEKEKLQMQASEVFSDTHLDDELENEHNNKAVNQHTTIVSEIQGDVDSHKEMDNELESDSTNKSAIHYTKKLSDTPIPEGVTHKLDYVITPIQSDTAGNIQTGRVFANSEQESITQLVNLYADMLAQEFALSKASSNEFIDVEIIIRNINSLGDYVQMMNVVNTIPAVNSVFLVKQSKDTAVLKVNHSTQNQQLRSILNLDSRLNSRVNSEQNTLFFDWQE